MADISTAFTALESLSPAELQNKRAELTRRMQTEFKGYDDPLLPETLISELLQITRLLRRKTAGPPKVSKAKAGPKTKVDATSLMDSI